MNGGIAGCNICCHWYSGPGNSTVFLLLPNSVCGFHPIPRGTGYRICASSRCLILLNPFSRAHPTWLLKSRLRTTRWPTILEKVAEYLKAGIPHVWMPDPYRNTLHIAGADDFRLCSDLAAETDLVGRVEFAGLFEKLDRLEK